MRTIAAAVALLTLALAAAGQSINNDLTFAPGRLDSHTPLTAIASGAWSSGCVPETIAVHRDGMAVALDIAEPPSRACIQAGTFWSLPVVIGPLPPGVYSVVLRFRGEVYAQRSVTIADADSPVILTEDVGPRVAGPSVRIRLRDSGLLRGATVTFDDVPATVVSSSFDEVVVDPPRHDAGPATVKVTVADGTVFTAFAAYRYVDVFSETVDRAAYEAILVPLVFAGPGAFGAQWTTDLWVHNGNNFEVTELSGPFANGACLVPPCLQRLDRNATTPHRSFAGQFPHGSLMHVARSSAAGLSFGLRVRDLAQPGTAPGTEIPVVRERDLRGGVFSLLDVPSDALFRAKIRVYALTTPRDPHVDVRFFDISSPYELLGSKLVTLEPATKEIPAYAELDLGTITSKLPKAGPYRVEIDPPFFSSPIYWAFISITNNQTQHVTVITPH